MNTATWNLCAIENNIFNAWKYLKIFYRGIVTLKRHSLLSLYEVALRRIKECRLIKAFLCYTWEGADKKSMKEAFNKTSGKIPIIKELVAEYDQVLSQKQLDFA